jgi:hypothetical protein
MEASFGVGNQTEWGWLTVPIGRLAFPLKKKSFFAPAPHAKFKSAKGTVSLKPQPGFFQFYLRCLVFLI